MTPLYELEHLRARRDVHDNRRLGRNLTFAGWIIAAMPFVLLGTIILHSSVYKVVLWCVG
jgi:hypothetical protein